jgi:hypothetical protein
MKRCHRFCPALVFPGAFLLALPVLLSLVLPAPVCAQTNEFVPYVSVRQEYSDNIVFSRVNEEEDFITTGNVGMLYTHRDARVRALLDARVSRLAYWDNDQLDSTDGLVRGSWKYQVTERAGAGLAASYRNDSRRDEDLDVTGVVLTGDRDRFDVSGSADYRFSEITAGELTVGYTYTEVDGIRQDEEYDTIQVDFGLTRNLSRTFKNTTGLFNVRYMRYSSEVDSTGPDPLFIDTLSTFYREFDSDVFQVTAGFSRNITELYTVYMTGGVSYTDTTENRRVVRTGLVNSVTSLPDQDSDSFGGVLAAGVNYTGLYYNVRVGVSHGISGDAGTNGVVERTALTLGVDRRVSENFSLTLAASGYLNRNERETLSDLDQRTLNIQPGFRYRITDTLNLSGAYRYTHVDDRDIDQTRERSLVYLEIRKEFDL